MLSGALAEDQIRAAQQVLKDQGFYYGEVNGEPGSEIEAAVKRYQMRNGLEVTSQLNPETLAAMNLGGNIPIAEADKPAIQANPPVQSPKQPPPIPQAAMNPYSQVFAGTPYERAPDEVQRGTFRQAQLKLSRAGYYRGGIDGVPGNETARAILIYQDNYRLQRTGRLDMSTLANLDLLPRRVPPHPREVPVPARPVYRGIWIQ